MIEAKVDDLVAKHPAHAEAIRAYHAADPTPTKKFLPWLTKQHIAGNVTPNDVRLDSTLQHFDKVKHQLTTKDHSGYNYNDLANKVGDRVKSKLEADTKKNAVETIHKEPNGITAQHIKTKEASQNLYGGGPERGGKKGCAHGTSWCVSARSEDNVFNDYGHMYTIHDPNDEHAPYAVHPFSDGGRITSRHNDGDKPYKEVVNKNPKIKNAVDKIMQHSSKNINSLINSKNNDEVYHGVSHPNATAEHITKALNTPGWHVRAAAVRHPNATADHITKALNDESAGVRGDAILHPKATTEQITKALGDKHSSVRKSAIRNPNATADHITKALLNRDAGVRMTAIRHPNATADHITKALNDKDPLVRMTALQHPNVTDDHITKALNDENHYVHNAAMNRRKYGAFNIEHVNDI